MKKGRRLFRGIAYLVILAAMGSALDGCYFIMRSKFENKMSSTSMQIAELEKRVGKLEASREAASNPEALAAYEGAMKLYYAGDTDAARKGLESLVSTYPDDRHSAMARFWLGEIYFAGRNYMRAAEEYERAAKEYPYGDKTPEAVYKAGQSYEKLGRTDDAVKAYNRVVNLYSHSDAAGAARERLKAIE